MNISGIGIVFARGRGIGSYEAALKEGWVAPALKELPSLPGTLLPAYEVGQETMTDREVLKKLRRADRFSKMAALAAWDAVQDSGIELEEKKSTLGIIVATGFGPHVTTFRFLDDVINFGEAGVSPTVFSHTVHNAAAGYIAILLAIRGPSLTVTQFVFSFQQALILARAWLQEKRCEYVLVGSVDECGEVMEYVCNRKLRIAPDGKIKPFQFLKKPEAVPGEGSVFFLVTNRDCPKKYCEINSVFLNGDIRTEDRPDIYILEADGMSGDETVYRNTVDSDVPVAGYAPIFGSIMTGSSFQCAAGALMLKNQVRYASPVVDNPHGLNVCTVTAPAEINQIHTVRYDCAGEIAQIRLKKIR